MNQSIHIGEEIKQELNIQDRSVAWLAKQISSDPSNLYKRLKHQDMHIGLLRRISVALNVDFFEKLSHDLSEKLRGVYSGTKHG